PVEGAHPGTRLPGSWARTGDRLVRNRQRSLTDRPRAGGFRERGRAAALAPPRRRAEGRDHLRNAPPGVAVEPARSGAGRDRRPGPAPVPLARILLQRAWLSPWVPIRLRHNALRLKRSERLHGAPSP